MEHLLVGLVPDLPEVWVHASIGCNNSIAS